MQTDPTRLPASARAWIGARLSGPPAGGNRHSWAACIHKVDRLGDFVLALSAIRRLLEFFGEEKCLLVVSSASAALAAREFPHTARFVLPVDAPGVLRDLVPAWRRERPKFRGHSCEHRICLTHQRDLWREVAITWVATARDWRLTRATYPATAPEDLCLKLQAHRQLVAEVTGQTVSAAEILPRLKTVTTGDDGRLLICPFANEAARTLPTALLVASLRAWRLRSAAPAVLCASPDQTAPLRALAAALAAAGITGVETVQPADVDALVETLARAGAVLAPDSAPAHLATALDRPACIVTGGGTFGLCSPWRRSDRQRHFFHHVPCFGCGWRCHRTEAFCVTQIAPADIAAALPAL